MTSLNKNWLRRLASPHGLSALCSTITVSLGVSSLIVACGAPPAPAPPPSAPTWSTLIKREASQPTAPKRVQVTHELWTTSEVVPSLSRAEVALASTGVLADIGGSGGSYQVDVGNNLCKTQWGEVDATARSTLDSRVEGCKAQLTPQQLKELKRATHRLTLSCEGEALAGIVELHNITVSFAKALETPNAQEGEVANERKPKPIWVEGVGLKCGNPVKLTQFLTQNHIQTQSAQLAGGAYVVWTQGLSAFGLPEIGLAPLTEEKVEHARAKMISLADSALRFDGLSEGMSIESGVARGRYVKLSRVAERLPQLASAPAKAQAALIVVDAKAKVDNMRAQEKISQRFARP